MVKEITRKSGKKYTQRDNTRFKIILWGYSHSSGFLQNSIFKDSKSGVSGQKWIELSNRLDELIEWGLLVKKKSDVVNRDVYSLTERGNKIANEIIEWENKFPELWNFESFRGVKRID